VAIHVVPLPLLSSLRNPQRHSFALVLSLAAHVAIGFMIGTGARPVSSPRWTTLLPPVISVQLVTPPSPPHEVPMPSTHEAATTAAGTTNTTAVGRPDKTSSSSESRPATPHTVPTITPQMESTSGTEPKSSLLAIPEPRYFPLNELSDRPQLIQNIPAEKTLAIPDAPTQPVPVKILINELGNVDKVVFLDSSFSEEAKQFINESFATVKFQPGKIGELAVKSQIRVEVTLERVLPKPITIFISGPASKDSP
jgi:hypothetical protein